MISPELATLVSLFFYACGFVAVLWGMAGRQPIMGRVGCWLTALAFIFQTFILALGFHKAFPTGLSIGAYLQLLAWFLALCGLVIWWKFKQTTFLFFATPLCLTLFILSAPYLGYALPVSSALKAPFYALHIATLFSSLALLTVAFMAGLLFLVLEKKLKKKKNIKGFWQDMPALSILDKINNFTTFWSFPLYTLGLVAGFFWSATAFGLRTSVDPKEILSLLVWSLLALIFYNRLLRNWTGRKPAILVIIVFLLCLFSFFIVNTMMDTHHAFIRN